jgi:drug/metabolite transporter superfamily protein YnfA
MRSSLRYVALGLGLVGCLSSTSPQLIGEGRPILFIGNSYTYVNDLPGIVQALADSAGGDRIAVETVAEPDYALVDHLADGTAQREISKRGWAFVVLQQGPSSVDINRDTLRLAAKAFAPLIAAAGGKPALFSAWPTVDRRVDFGRAIESYKLAAVDVGGVFLPVASAWLAAWDRDSTLALYDFDGLHASVIGSYLSALVIYGRLMNHSVVGLPSTLRLRSGTTISVDSRRAGVLQQAAAAALASNP